MIGELHIPSRLGFIRLWRKTQWSAIFESTISRLCSSRVQRTLLIVIHSIVGTRVIVNVMWQSCVHTYSSATSNRCRCRDSTTITPYFMPSPGEQSHSEGSLNKIVNDPASSEIYESDSEDGEALDFSPGAIEGWERFWCRHQPWLETKGYMLRRRYRPDWVPSWLGTNLHPALQEDGATPGVRS